MAATAAVEPACVGPRPGPDRVGRGRAQHRDPVVGLRQHRHPLPRVPPAGRAALRLREARRRGDRQPLHRDRADGEPAHPVGQGGRLGRAQGARGHRGLKFGGINSNTFQDLDYKLGSVCHPDATVRAKAVGAIVECNEIASVLDAQAVKVWLGDGTNYPGQDDLRGRHRRLLAGLREVYATLPADTRLYLEYKFYEPALYSTDVQDWGQSLNVDPPARRPRRRVRGHGPPRDGREHRADRRPAPGGGEAVRLRPQRQEVRRRRPDGRLDRSVPAVPDHPRARERDARRRRPGRTGDRQRHRLHARPVPQHRAQGPGHDPLGDEPPGDDREGAARGPRAAGRGTGRGRRARGELAACGTRSTPTSARSSPSCASPAAFRRTRTARTSPRARSRRSTPPASAARRPAGDPGSTHQPRHARAPATAPTRRRAMNSRERVLRALRRDGLPDRVPLQFDLCRPLLEAFGKRSTASRSATRRRTTRTSSTGRRATSCASRWAATAWSSAAGCRPATSWRRSHGGMHRQRVRHADEAGHRSGWTSSSGPLANATTVEEVLDIPFPDPFDEGRFVDRQGHHRPLQGRVLHHRRRRADDVRDGLAHGRPREVHGRHGHARALHRGRSSTAARTSASGSGSGSSSWAWTASGPATTSAPRTA